MSGPLSGLKVIEMSGIGPCPLAGQMLGDLGAEVIIIDRKKGQADATDINRRSKTSIVLNLKTPKGVELALKMIANADVLIEGYRPGVMERLGLGPDKCLAANPRLVYGRMTGWGQTGPLSSTAGHDINYLAISGLLGAMGHADRPPIPPLNMVADYAGGTMFLLFGILSALYERNQSGKGQVIDAAMVDGAPMLAGLIHGMIAQGKWVEERQSNWLDGGMPFYRTYETADGKYMSVGPLEPQFFAEFGRIMGLSEAEVKNQYTPASIAPMHDKLEDLFKQKTQDEWTNCFEASDACVAPVLSWSQAPNHPHNKARGTFFENEGVVQASPAPRFSRTPTSIPIPPAAPGEGRDAILKKLGLDSEEIDGLIKKNIVE